MVIPSVSKTSPHPSLISFSLTEISTIWKNVLDQVKLSVSPGIFITYFSGSDLVRISALDADHLTADIAFPNSFIRENVDHKYHQLVADIFHSVTGKNVDISYSVRSVESPTKSNKTTEIHTPLFDEKQDLLLRAKKSHLRPDFTFETFAVSSSNQMAWAAASAVARSPGNTYNPLFLYGGVGVGKTHLMQAIGQAIFEKKPEARVIYCSGEEFTNEIVEAIRTNTTQKFKEKYRTADALLLDDIQFIAGKEKVQEEFFHTFNVIMRDNGQVVLTSDRPPQEIQKMEDRLRTRFEAGLVIDVPEPDLELRAAILLIKAQQKKIDFPSSLAPLVAETIEHPRQLEGFLVKLQNEILVHPQSITQELVHRLLGTAAPDAVLRKLISPQDIITLVAQYYQTTINQMKGERRSQPLAHQRQTLMYVLHKEVNLPTTEIGRILGGRDHTTVMHGLDKITRDLPNNQLLVRDLEAIKKLLCG